MAIAAGSFVLKAILVWAVANMPCTHDQCEYLTLADGLRSGQGIQLYDGFLWPPGFIAFLAACLSLFGDSLTSPRMVQVLLSTVTVGVVYALGRRLADSRAGLAAAALFAFYPNLVGFTHLLWPETLYIFLFSCGLLFLVRDHAPAPRQVIAAGLCIGLAALVRGIAFFFAPVAAAWLAWRFRHRPLLAPLLLVATAAVVAPWTVRNAVQYHRLVLIDTTVGHNLYIGTNVSPPSNWDLGFNDRRRIRDGRPRCDEANPADRDGCELRHGLAFIATHPWLMLRRVPVKLADLLNPSSFVLRHAVLGHYPHAFGATALRILTLVVVLPYVAVVVLGVLGLGLGPARPGQQLILLLLAYHLAVHAVTFGMTRFRLPLMPFLMAAAGLLLTRSWRPLLAAASRRRLVVTGATLAVLAGLWIARLSPLLDVFRAAG
ncbi:MAG: ArnT family glycosyltransferase [Acidobacteriota bacterium]